WDAARVKLRYSATATNSINSANSTFRIFFPFTDICLLRVAECSAPRGGRLNSAFSTGVEHDVTEHLAARHDFVHLGDPYERKASPEGGSKASLSQPLAELANAGRALSLVHVVGSGRRCRLDGRRSEAAHP